MSYPTVPRTAPLSERVKAPVAVAAAAGAVCAFVWWADPTTPGGVIPVCPTKLLFGIDCPGCGTMRMLYSMLHGDLHGAVRFNALAVAALVLLVWTYAVWAYGRVAGRQIRNWQHRRWAAPVTLLAVTAWFVMRNLPFAPFTALRV
jgi:Protein of unknown function (DUF2752)